MHSLCMASKTISLRTDAYERLRRARRSPSESFTDVVLRATWPETTVTGGELLHIYRENGLFFTERSLRRVEELKAEDRPPEDKWLTLAPAAPVDTLDDLLTGVTDENLHQEVRLGSLGGPR